MLGFKNSQGEAKGDRNGRDHGSIVPRVDEESLKKAHIYMRYT